MNLILTIIYLVFSTTNLANCGNDPEVIKILEAEGSKLEADNFENDPYLIQDFINDTTIYHTTGNEPPVFKRVSNDVGRNIIVLNSDEDRLRTYKSQNIYVVLKQKADKNYYVMYAYLRNSLPSGNPSNVVSIKNKNYNIEWEAWTRRGSQQNKAATLYGWTTCTESIFTPCKSKHDNNKKLNILIDENVNEQIDASIADNIKSKPELLTNDFLFDLENSESEILIIKEINLLLLEILIGQIEMDNIVKHLETIGQLKYKGLDLEIDDKSAAAFVGLTILNELFSGIGSDVNESNIWKSFNLTQIGEYILKKDPSIEEKLNEDNANSGFNYDENMDYDDKSGTLGRSLDERGSTNAGSGGEDLEQKGGVDPDIRESSGTTGVTESSGVIEETEILEIEMPMVSESTTEIIIETEETVVNTHSQIKMEIGMIETMKGGVQTFESFNGTSNSTNQGQGGAKGPGGLKDQGGAKKPGELKDQGGAKGPDGLKGHGETKGSEENNNDNGIIKGTIRAKENNKGDGQRNGSNLKGLPGGNMNEANLAGKSNHSRVNQNYDSNNQGKQPEYNRKTGPPGQSKWKNNGLPPGQNKWKNNGKPPGQNKWKNNGWPPGQNKWKNNGGFPGQNNWNINGAVYGDANNGGPPGQNKWKNNGGPPIQNESNNDDKPPGWNNWSDNERNDWKDNQNNNWNNNNLKIKVNAQSNWNNNNNNNWNNDDRNNFNINVNTQNNLASNNQNNLKINVNANAQNNWNYNNNNNQNYNINAQNNWNYNHQDNQNYNSQNNWNYNQQDNQNVNSQKDWNYNNANIGVNINAHNWNNNDGNNNRVSGSGVTRGDSKSYVKVRLRVTINQNSQSGGSYGGGRVLAESEPNWISQHRKEYNTDVDLFRQIGWKTQGLSNNELNKTTDNDEIFIGFGNCPPGEKNVELKAKEDTQNIIKYYLTPLRMSCNEILKQRISSLIEMNYLRLTPDNTFEVSPAHKSLKKTKLSSKERGYLTTSFEFASFSKIYKTKMEKETGNKQKTSTAVDPNENAIPRRISTLIEVMLNSLNDFKSVGQTHYITLTRRLILTLKTCFTKILQDISRLKKCEVCNAQAKLEINGGISLLNLIEFVTKGLEKLGANLDYNTDFKSNFENVKKQLNSYM